MNGLFLEDEENGWLGASGSVSGLPMQLSSLGIPQFYLRTRDVEPVKERPFFLTVALSDKGKKAGLVEKEDGIYTKFGTKLIDREMLVR